MTETSAATFPDFAAVAKQCFEQFKVQLAAYGLEIDPALEVRPKPGFMGYYHLEDRCIYVSYPDMSASEGKLHLMVLRSLMACDANEELIALLNVLVPHTMAHEMAHHLRHHYGTWTDNSWQEEHIANQVAVGLTRHLIPPAARACGLALLQRAVNQLAKRLGVDENLAVTSYHNVAQALQVEGKLSDATISGGQLMQSLFDLDSDVILNEWAEDHAEVRDALNGREQTIESIAKDYNVLINDLARYAYYSLCWIYLDMSSEERPYLSNLARRYFNRHRVLLPTVTDHQFMGEKAILACFQAAQDCQSRSPAAADYFYKRYRAALLAMLQAVDMSTPEQTERVRKEAGFLLQSWSGHNNELDLLNYLISQAPGYVQEFFPERIADHPDLDRIRLPENLPSETDRRLWLHLIQEEMDQGAVNTLARLSALHRVELYRALPAGVLMEFAHSINPILLESGDALIWEGEENQDVYIVAEGQFELSMTLNGKETPINILKQGDVIGEVAFFTKGPRIGTVRATMPAECYVLQETDLRILGFKYPVILMQMARVLAERLSRSMRTIR